VCSADPKKSAEHTLGNPLPELDLEYMLMKYSKEWYILMDTILTKTEDELQTAANTVNKFVRKYNMNMSTTKTKSMAICGKNIQRAKIVIDDTIIAEVTDFII
jgi:hypothetical protein